MEGPSYSKLTHFMSHHVFADIDGDELLAVMDGKGQPDKVREDGRTTGPGLDDLAILGRSSSLDLLLKVSITERAFFN